MVAEKMTPTELKARRGAVALVPAVLDVARGVGARCCPHPGCRAHPHERNPRTTRASFEPSTKIAVLRTEFEMSATSVRNGANKRGSRRCRRASLAA